MAAWESAIAHASDHGMAVEAENGVTHNPLIASSAAITRVLVVRVRFVTQSPDVSNQSSTSRCRMKGY